MANALSRNAATTSAAMTSCEAPCAPAINNTDAVMVNAAPTPCANLFGGPGTNRCSSESFGVITCVANRPSGLNVGPARTRATNP